LIITICISVSFGKLGIRVEKVGKMEMLGVGISGLAYSPVSPFILFRRNK
jgi:hypothetical protein